jgi:hypothetical protein
MQYLLFNYFENWLYSGGHDYCWIWKTENVLTSHLLFNYFQNRKTYREKLNTVAFSPQANYTDRATVACRRS